MTENNQTDALKKALTQIEELKIPQHLQDTSLKFLLNLPSPTHLPPKGAALQAGIPPASQEVSDLRSFMASVKLTGAVNQIPCLLYWAKQKGEAAEADEKAVIELYRRAGLKPPKNVTQSIRDLCSKKYGRLEVTPGQSGYVQISRVGEDFVIHDATKG